MSLVSNMSNRTLNIYLKVLFKPIFFFISLILWYSNLYAQVNWTKVSSVSDFYLEFLKLQNGKLLCAAGNPNTGSVVNAIYETSNLRSWTAKSATFSSAIHLFFGQTSSGDLYIPTAHNGVYKSTNNGVSWSYNFASGYGCGALSFSEDTSGTLFVGVGGSCRGIHTSTNGGSSWSNKLSGIDFTCIETIPSTNRTYASGSNTVYYTDDNGNTWTQITSEPFSYSTILIQCLGNKVYILTNDGKIYESNNNGGSWSLHSSISLSSNATAYANAMVQNSSGDFWVSYNQQRIWYLKNQTTTWVKLDSLLPSDLIDLYIQNDTLLVSTSDGIYMKNGNPNSKSWTGTGNFSNASNWSSGSVPTSSDSAVIRSGILTINSSRTLDVLTIGGGATVKLAAPLTVRNLYIKNGTLDLNGQRLTVTGRIVQSTDSTNYYIQAGTSASPKPRSELAIKPSTSKNFTILINPNANRLYKLEIGNGSAAAQITLGNSIKIKGGEDGGNGPGLVTVNNNAKIIIPSGSALTLESDTFNAGLNLAQPAQRSIVCTGTGKFNIERDHFGVRGWRLYSHPFKTDIDLQEVANDIELIGPGGTAEGFYSNTYTNSAAYWYDYSKADSGATTDPAWTEFTSAKGSTISGNTNKWKKNSPLLLFNPGNRRGTDAFGSPSTATYEQGKITLSYTLDSTAVHLNDGTTQLMTATNIPSYVPTNDLVGYWPFNGNANDESRNGNHGTVNGATLVTDKQGNSNGAYNFDGSNDYVELGGIASTMNSSKGISLAMWLNWSGKNSTSSAQYIFLISPSPNGSISVGNDSLLAVNVTNCNCSNDTRISTKIIPNKWYFIVMTFDLATSNLKMYLNDTLIGNVSKSLYSYYQTNNSNSRLGNYYFNHVQQYFNGQIDEAFIWNRALTATETSNLYRASLNTSISAKSKYFFITNPFTMPVRLSKIDGLNSSNVDPYFYYWKQRRNTVTDNFSPAEWQAEKIVTGTAARDSNISIPAFGTILVRLKNSSTTFSIPESAKQLTNFNYIIGGAKGTSKTGLMFTDITGSNIGPNSMEIKLLVKDSLEADRVLVYDEQHQSNQYTTSDARKFVNPDFPNLFTYSQDGKPLALDMQDIAEQLNSGKSEVEIPLGVEREMDKRYATLHLQLSENNTEYLLSLKDKTTRKELQLQTLKTYPVEFKAEEMTIGRYSLVFRRATNSLKDIVTTKNTTASGSQSTQTGIFLYPNPASNQLYISTNQGDFRGTVEVCDLLGRVISTQTYSKEKPLNISKLQAGSYFVKTPLGTQLFIKE